MQLFCVSDEYINYLRKKFPRVYSNKENARVLYSKRKAGEEDRVVQNCLNFMELEEACDKWKRTISTEKS